MRKWILLSLFLGSGAFAGNTIQEISQRCGPLSPKEKKLFSSDFKWGYDLVEMLNRFVEVYNSSQRLTKRAYWDANRQLLVFPYDVGRGGDIALTEEFIQSVVHHVERAFALNYVDAVFFPDMGHSHFLIPEKLYQSKYDKFPVNNMAGMYSEMFRDPHINVLYHTAEQLKTLDENNVLLPDPKVQWRFRTRNIMGKIDSTTDLVVLQNPESKANTVGGFPGHTWWGGGFNISANKDGCFEFRAQGKKYYFDLSMFDLEPDPEKGDWAVDSY